MGCGFHRVDGVEDSQCCFRRVNGLPISTDVEATQALVYNIGYDKGTLPEGWIRNTANLGGADFSGASTNVVSQFYVWDPGTVEIILAAVLGVGSRDATLKLYINDVSTTTLSSQTLPTGSDATEFTFGSHTLSAGDRIQISVTGDSLPIDDLTGYIKVLY